MTSEERASRKELRNQIALRMASSAGVLMKEMSDTYGSAVDSKLVTDSVASAIRLVSDKLLLQLDKEPPEPVTKS